MFGFKKKDKTQKENEAREKRDMIEGIEELSTTTVKEVMVPRIDIDFIPNVITAKALMQKVRESGHSRFPVFSQSIDNVVGILYVKDLIYGLDAADIQGDKELALEKIIRKPYFVPESKRIDTLLREFKKKHLHIAMAIDEYGGIAGLVTMEDIIEEIVGDIQDEFDNEKEDIVFVGKGVYIADARVDLDDLNDAMGSNFPAEDFDSLGGFVFDLFGKVPVRFEKVTWGDYEFIIQNMDGHRINLIKIIKDVDKDNSGGDDENKST